MWGAIKSDLLSFVTTITDDTTKTINRVLGDKEEEEEDVSVQEKLVADLRRSFETYNTPIRDVDSRDYEKFKKKFNISSCAADIARVLDEEPEVSRFYAELVPISMSPEDFWGRLFFRINQIYRNGAANLDEDDEEELVWEEEEFTAHTDTPTATQEETNSKEDYEMNADANGAISGKKATSSQTAQSVSSDIGTSTHLSTTNKGAQTTAAPGAPSNVNVNDIVSVNEHMKERVVELEQENRRLLTQEEELYKRIQELEARLAAQAITEAAERGEASSATTTPQSKQSTQKSSVPATTPPTAAYYNTTTPPTAVRSTGKASAAATGVGAKKKASTAKKLFVDSPAVPSATATASATTAAGQDAVEVAPRNESSNSSSVLPPSPPAAAGEAPVAVSMTEMAAVMTAVAVADHMSLSSDESAVVVNRSDANSLDGDERPSTANTTNTATMPGSNAGQHQSKSGAVSSAGVASAGGSAAAGASPAKSTTSSFSSNETAKYLAALDDQEDEEDGWN